MSILRKIKSVVHRDQLDCAFSELGSASNKKLDLMAQRYGSDDIWLTGARHLNTQRPTGWHAINAVLQHVNVAFLVLALYMLATLDIIGATVAIFGYYYIKYVGQMHNKSYRAVPPYRVRGPWAFKAIF